MRVIIGGDAKDAPSGWTYCDTPERFMLLAISAENLTEVAFVDAGTEVPDAVQVFRWFLRERIISGRPWPLRVYFTSPNKAVLALARAALRVNQWKIPKRVLVMYRLPTD